MLEIYLQTHSDISIFAAVTYFIFYNFLTCTGVGKIFLQINSAAVEFIDILMEVAILPPTLNFFSLQILKFEKNLFIWKRKLKGYAF